MDLAISADSNEPFVRNITVASDGPAMRISFTHQETVKEESEKEDSNRRNLPPPNELKNVSCFHSTRSVEGVNFQQ